jgi:dTDP-4-dehydrorhamnose reductase
MDALSPSPVVIIGGSGMLGRAWRELLADLRVEFRAPSHADADLLRPETLEPAIADAKLVVNCAAWTSVDEAEARESDALALNGAGAGALARACASRDVPLVHYSSDYVFAGDADRPYRVDDPVAPRSAYGRTKAAGDEAVRAAGGRHLIVRTSWLYAPWGKNFVRTILGLARQRRELRVVNDQRGRPTSAQGLARTTWALLGAGATGTHHACDDGECTWFDLAAEGVRLAGLDCSVLPCATAEFPRPAPRPAYSVLDLGETLRLAGPMRAWRDALADVVRTIERSGPARADVPPENAWRQPS